CENAGSIPGATGDRCGNSSQIIVVTCSSGSHYSRFQHFPPNSQSRGEMRLIFRTMLGASLFAATAATASAQTKLVDTFNDWHLYSHNSSSENVCFVASTPKTSEPASANRQPTYFYISAWPKDGVRTELSVKFGYPFKEGS